MSEFVLPSPLVHDQHLHAVSIFGMKGISHQAKLHPKLQMVAFEVVELHSVTKQARAVDSITLLVNTRTMHLIDKIIQMCFNISGSQPASDVIKSNTLKHTSLKSRTWRR